MSKLWQQVSVNGTDITNAVIGWVNLAGKLVSNSGKPNYSITSKLTVNRNLLQELYSITDLVEQDILYISYRREPNTIWAAQQFVVIGASISSTNLASMDTATYDLVLQQSFDEKETAIPEWLLEASQHMYLPWTWQGTYVEQAIVLPRRYPTIFGLPEEPHRYGIIDVMGWLGSRESDARRWKTDGLTLGSLNWYSNDIMRTDGSIPGYYQISGSSAYYLGQRVSILESLGVDYKPTWAIVNNSNVYSLHSPRLEDYDFPTDFNNITGSKFVSYGTKNSMLEAEQDEIVTTVTTLDTTLPIDSSDKLIIPSASVYVGKCGQDGGVTNLFDKYITHTQVIGVPFVAHSNADTDDWDLKISSETGNGVDEDEDGIDDRIAVVSQTRERLWRFGEDNRLDMMNEIGNQYYLLDVDRSDMFVYASDANFILKVPSSVSYRYTQETEENDTNSSGFIKPEIKVYKINKQDKIAEYHAEGGYDAQRSEPGAYVNPEYLGELPLVLQPGIYSFVAHGIEIFCDNFENPWIPANEENEDERQTYCNYYSSKSNRVNQFLLEIEPLTAATNHNKVLSVDDVYLLTIASDDFSLPQHLTAPFGNDTDWDNVLAERIIKIDPTTGDTTNPSYPYDFPGGLFGTINKQVTTIDVAKNADTIATTFLERNELENYKNWNTAAGIQPETAAPTVAFVKKSGGSYDLIHTNASYITMDANSYKPHEQTVGSGINNFVAINEHSYRLITSGESIYKLTGSTIDNDGNYWLGITRKKTRNRLVNHSVIKCTWVAELGETSYPSTQNSVYGNAQVKFGYIELQGDATTELTNGDKIKIWIPPIIRDADYYIGYYTAISYPVNHNIVSIEFDVDNNRTKVWIDPPPNHHGYHSGEFTGAGFPDNHWDLVFDVWFQPNGPTHIYPTAAPEEWSDATAAKPRIWRRESAIYEFPDFADQEKYRQTLPQMWKVLPHGQSRAELWTIPVSVINNLPIGYKGSLRYDDTHKYCSEIVAIATENITLDNQSSSFDTEGTYSIVLESAEEDFKDGIEVKQGDTFVAFTTLEQNQGLKLLVNKEYSNLTITYTKYSDAEYYPISGANLGQTEDIVIYQDGRFYDPVQTILPTNVNGRYYWNDSLVELLGGEQIGGSASGKVMADPYVDDDKLYLPILHGDTVRMLQETNYPVASQVKFTADDNQADINHVASEFGFIRPQLLNTTSTEQLTNITYRQDTVTLSSNEILHAEVSTLWTDNKDGMYVVYDDYRYPDEGVTLTDPIDIKSVVDSANPVAVTTKYITSRIDAYHRWIYERLMHHNELPELVVTIRLSKMEELYKLDQLGALFIIETNLPQSIQCRRFETAFPYGILKETKYNTEKGTTTMKFNLLPDSFL